MRSGVWVGEGRDMGTGTGKGKVHDLESGGRFASFSSFYSSYFPRHGEAEAIVRLSL